MNLSKSNRIINPHLEGQGFYWRAGSIGVLLSHGFGATTAEVRPLAKVLHSQGVSVSAPLLPGHFSSIQEINRCRWQDWAEAYQAAYLELAEDCEVIYLGGESMGALLALYLASQVNAHTEPYLHHNPIRGVLAYAPVIKHRVSYAPLISYCLGSVKQFVQKPPHAPSSVDDLWQGYSVYPLPAARELFRLQAVARGRLKYILTPILVIQGDQDRSVHSSGPDIIRREASSTAVDIHWVKETGHCVALEKKIDQVAKLTMDFITRHA